ncbi:restriction endonuclease [Spongiibacter marinus]|uniref:restriction endonuclease n=1 Tax=Spongiibacter marinus TaxID=354246 RepID=UPI00195FB236|nr:restriction endonuclease [Spongiibacter marinus]MBM7424827.1 HJR/Mrr/RecB family endonuclease [Spongiibacter marinus]
MNTTSQSPEFAEYIQDSMISTPISTKLFVVDFIIDQSIYKKVSFCGDSLLISSEDYLGGYNYKISLSSDELIDILEKRTSFCQFMNDVSNRSIIEVSYDIGSFNRTELISAFQKYFFDPYPDLCGRTDGEGEQIITLADLLRDNPDIFDTVPSILLKASSSEAVARKLCRVCFSDLEFSAKHQASPLIAIVKEELHLQDLDGYGFELHEDNIFVDNLDASKVLVYFSGFIAEGLKYLADNYEIIQKDVAEVRGTLLRKMRASEVPDEWGNVDSEDIEYVAQEYFEARHSYTLNTGNLVCTLAVKLLKGFIEETANEIERELDNSPELSGIDFENSIVELLGEAGIKSFVTKSSGDQGVDVLAEAEGKRIAIQAKYYSSNVGNSAVQQVYTGKGFYSCDHAVVVTNSQYTKSARELAATLGVYLCHYSELINTINHITEP